MAGQAVHMPPSLVADLSAQTPPGRWVDETIDRALEAFANLGAETRGDIVRDYWWQGSRRGSWRKLRIGDKAWKLAKSSKPGAWSQEQTLVAACDWFARRNW